MCSALSTSSVPLTFSTHPASSAFALLHLYVYPHNVCPTALQDSWQDCEKLQLPGAAVGCKIRRCVLWSVAPSSQPPVLLDHQWLRHHLTNPHVARCLALSLRFPT